MKRAKYIKTFICCQMVCNRLMIFRIWQIFSHKRNDKTAETYSKLILSHLICCNLIWTLFTICTGRNLTIQFCLKYRNLFETHGSCFSFCFSFSFSKVHVWQYVWQYDNILFDMSGSHFGKLGWKRVKILMGKTTDLFQWPLPYDSMTIFCLWHVWRSFGKLGWKRVKILMGTTTDLFQWPFPSLGDPVLSVLIGEDGEDVDQEFAQGELGCTCLTLHWQAHTTHLQTEMERDNGITCLL